MSERGEADVSDLGVKKEQDSRVQKSGGPRDSRSQSLGQNPEPQAVPWMLETAVGRGPRRGVFHTAQAAPCSSEQQERGQLPRPLSSVPQFPYICQGVKKLKEITDPQRM